MRAYYDSRSSLNCTKNKFLPAGTSEDLSGRHVVDGAEIPDCQSSTQNCFLCGYAFDQQLFYSVCHNGADNEQLHTE